jgi:uncharacterized protein YejL (UPF0352 family)
MDHDWEPSTISDELGFEPDSDGGDLRCTQCGITTSEAAVLGVEDYCDTAAANQKEQGMSDNIATLTNKNDEPDSDVISVLEKSLQRARAGDLRSVMVVGNLVGNAVYTNYSSPDMVLLLGQMQYAANHILNALSYEELEPPS